MGRASLLSITRFLLAGTNLSGHLHVPGWARSANSAAAGAGSELPAYGGTAQPGGATQGMAVPAPLAAAGLRVVLGPAGSIGRVPTGPRLGYVPPPWGWLEGLQGADRSMAASGGAERLQLPWELRFLLMLTPGPSQLLPEAPCSLLFRSHEMPFAFFRAPRSSWHGPAVTQRCPSPRGASQGRSDTALPNPCSRQNNNKKAREPAEKTSHPYLCSSAGAAAGSPARRAPHCQLSTGVFLFPTRTRRGSGCSKACWWAGCHQVFLPRHPHRCADSN